MYKTLIHKSVIVGLMFFTLFPVNFVFLPSAVSTRLLVATLGVFFILYNTSLKKKIVSKEITKIYFFSFLIVIWSFLCTVFFNHEYDFTYVKHLYTITIMLLSTYSCTQLIKQYHKKLDFNIVTQYFLSVILVQSAIVFLIFFSSSAADFFIGLQKINEREINIINVHVGNQTRFIGFGLMFYTASFFYGTALILLAYQIKNRNNTKKQIFIFYSLYTLFILVGMGLARTTMIGLAISIIILIIPLKYNKRFTKNFFGALFFFISLIILFNIYILFNPNIIVKYEGFINNVFEVFINLAKEGKVESNSASGTFNMFVLPKNEITYFLGTGIYDRYTSFRDFNYSDIGYLRLLYYSGFLGIFLFLIFEINLLKTSFYNKGYKSVFMGLLMLLLITNIKGVTTLAIIAFLYLDISSKNKIH